MQALKPAPPPEALVLALGAAEPSGAAPGGSAQLVKVRAAALSSAPARVKVFFTSGLLGNISTTFLAPSLMDLAIFA